MVQTAAMHHLLLLLLVLLLVLRLLQYKGAAPEGQASNG